jgi:Tol biopolymer transport system component
LTSDPSKFPKGAHLGDYEIHSLLGAGGMGEVYRARDLRLRREVAIKVLPASFASDADRLRRFEQEATAAAALNHPNILAVYQMGTHEGAPYLVSELLEGETLRGELQRGPLPARKVTDYGTQIAHGLAAAHEKGIVHRDLKPENLFVTKDGRVKILDFGLAKLTQPQAGTDSNHPTLTGATDPGVVMGTAGYMAPEQVRGEATDHRADIFSFGAILYEMLAGKRAFQKPTSPETMTAILKEDPPGISQVMPATPPALQRVVHRCLEKNLERRFQSASDLAFALESLSDSGASSAIGATNPAARPGLNSRWLAAISAAVLMIGGVLVWLNRPRPQPRVLRTTQLTHDGVSKGSLVTDGARLYVGELGAAERIMQVSVNGGETSLVPTPFTNTLLFNISPDHTQLLVASRVGTETYLPIWSLPLPSGAPRRLADLTFALGVSGIAWSPDGRHLLITKESEFYEADMDGTNLHKLVTVSGTPHQLAFSPDGNRISLTIQQNGTDSLWEMHSDGSHLRRLFEPGQLPGNSCCGGWSPDGRYFFFDVYDASSANLWAMREASGLFPWHRPVPVQLTTGPLAAGAWASSLDGKKLFMTASQAKGELVRYDSNSKEFVPFLGGMSAGELDYSRDGKWLTYISYPDQTLWRSRADGSDKLQLTYSPVRAALPRWSPDGTQIGYLAATTNALVEILVMPRDGGTAHKVFAGESSVADPSWSPDGKRLALGGFHSAAAGIGIIELETKKVSSVPGSDQMFSPRWSPDGKYLAAISSDSTKLFLYDFATQKWSNWVDETAPFGFPNWSADSQYLYYDTTFTEAETFRRVRVGQSHSELIADLKGLKRYSQPPAYEWSGLAPDGSALFVRNLSTDEVYALDVDLP